MKLKEGTKTFKFAIAIDRLFNVVTGGSFQECLSTRAYIQAAQLGSNRQRWVKIRNIIDRCFWDGHCKDSFIYEMRIKSEYVANNKNLL